ncbi:MAG: hypothetical protein GWP14_02160 [Actinobacteria bacterium]|nr:hypothetical protein [Actinomycetota bacterium]
MNAGTSEYPKLLFNSEEIEAIKQKIARYGWARRLFEKLKSAVDGIEECFLLGHPRFTLTDPPADLSAFPDEGEMRGIQFVHQSRLHELAMVGLLRGDPKYARRVRQVLIVLAEVLPRGNDLSLQPQFVNWTTGHDALELLLAYDLIYNDPGWTDTERKKVEEAFKIVMQQILCEPSARHLCNTSFYYQPYKVACGCFFNRQDWIDEGLKGRGGFFDALSEPEKCSPEMRWYEFGGDDGPHRRLQRYDRGTADGMLWNESGVYGGAMLSQYCILADLMRHYDGTDLWNYEAPGGGSIRGMFDGLILRAFNDGDVALFGENGMYDRRHREHEKSITSGIKLFNLPAKHIGRAKFELAYARYEDPGFGWLALRNSRRDDSDNKLGYCALWYGRDASEMQVSPPDIKSHTFKTFGTAMLRSTEGPDFWSSETPTVAVTWGAAKYRSHPDQFSFILRGMGKVLEPDLVCPWDYGVPQGGRNLTPFTASSWAHNVLIVDGRNHGTASGKLVVDDYGEHIKVIGLAGDRIHPGSGLESVEMGRWLGLSREYLLDITYIAAMHLPHRFDLVIPAYGELTVPGIALEDYDLGADLGFGKIDLASNHPENRWITDGKKAPVPETWNAQLENPDGVNLALHFTGWDTGEVLVGKVPICWAPHLEESPRGDPESLRGRYTILIHRKSRRQEGGKPNGLIPCHSEDQCHFFTVHEPFRDEPRVRSVRRVPLAERKAKLWDPFGNPFPQGKLGWTTPRVMEIKADDFTDYFVYIDHFIARRGGEPGRAVLETPVFRIDFSGPYAYFRIVSGKVAAKQGNLKSVTLLRSPGDHP